MTAIGSAQSPWTMTRVNSTARSRGTTAEGRLIAVFDVFHEVYRRTDTGARDFRQLLSGTAEVPDFDLVVSSLANEAALARIPQLVAAWRILTQGSACSSVDGAIDSALGARGMALDLIERHRAPLRAFAIDIYAEVENQRQYDALEWSSI